MDSLSAELQAFLVQMGQNPGCVSERTTHYMKHLLQLLTEADQQIFKQYYGFFGHEVVTLADIAYHHGVPEDTMQHIIEANLRRLAVTPEWQMIKQFTTK